LGEFVRSGEPEFEGAVERAFATEADAGEPTLNGVVQACVVVGRRGSFENEQGGVQRSGELLRSGKEGGQRPEIDSLSGIGVRIGDPRFVGIRRCGHGHAFRVEIVSKSGEEHWEPDVTDLLKDFRRGKVWEFRSARA
jgi:hypothetical protein